MRRFRRARAEPTITLINVVFLLLAFFLVAGSIAEVPPAGLRLVSYPAGAPAPSPGSVALDAGGATLWPDGVSDAATFVAGLPPEADGIARILPDRDAPALALVALARELRASGAAEVRMLVEQDLGR